MSEHIMSASAGRDQRQGLALFCATAADAKLRELRGHDFPLRDGIHLLVNVENAAVLPDIERPPGRERLVFVDDAVRLRDEFRRVAEQWVVDTQRLRKLPVDLRGIDANRKIRDVELSNRIATLTE
jgi:hypothetical protein